MNGGERPDPQAYVNALLAQMSELEAETDKPVRAQHLVSQVLLARFTEPLQHGQVLQPVDLDHPAWFQKTRPTAAVGYEESFVRFASASLERLWGEVETRLPKALQAVDDGVLFDDPQDVDVLRDCLALHLVRSHTYREIHRQSFREAAQNTLDRFRGPLQGVIENYVLRTRGLYLAGPGGVDYYARRVIAESDVVRRHEDHQVLRVYIEEQFAKARAWLRTVEMKIYTPAPDAGEFVIGDTPAYAVTGGPGPVPVQAPLLEARLVGMPLGPGHQVVLSGGGGYAEADAATVELFNVLQVARAQRHVYLRPSSGVQAWVRNAAPELRDPANEEP